MDALISQLLNWLNTIATTLSLEVFVLLGAFLEEIIAPIPSPFVMTQAAVFAKVQNYTVLQLAWLVLLASAGKTLSSYVLYVITDRAEDVVIGRFGKYFGVSHTQIEKIGHMLSKSWWDDVLLFLSRALPFVPTSLVTVAAGAIKYNMTSFITMTFLGTIVRSLFYLWVGYVGWTYFNQVRDQLLQSPLSVGLLILVIAVGIVVALKLKNKLWDKVMEEKKPPR